MKQVFYAYVLVIVVTSCNQPNNTSTIQPSPVDSLVGAWIKNWNSHDSTAIKNMFAPDVLLMDDNMIAKNQDEVISKLIRPNIMAINNMKAEKITEWVSNDRAFFAGTYGLDVIVNDSLIDQPKGFWTVGWKRNDKDEWKIYNVHINSITIKTLERKEGTN